MDPFLCDQIGHLLRTLMRLFDKKSVLKEADITAKLLKLDVSSSDVRCNYKEVDVRVAAMNRLSEVKPSDLEKMNFRKQCIDFLSRKDN